MAQKLSNLPIGAKIKFGSHQIASETKQPIIWVVADKNHSGYPANSVTLVTQKLIDSLAYDAKETSFSDGNPDYALSNINQWLNSANGASKWYSATHSADVAPSYQSRPGFLYNFTEDERNAILVTTLTVQKTAEVSTSITPKVFLLSNWEIMGAGSFNDGSSRLAYFKSNAVTAVVTEQVFNNSSSKPTVITEIYPYFTRSIYERDVIYVDTTGITEAGIAKTTKGIRPALNLASNTKISDNVDADGCYTLRSNVAPTITGTNSDLGNKTAGFSYAYTIGDTDNDGVTVTEYIDNVELRSYVAALNTETNFAVTDDTWLKLANGKHTLKISATDGFATTERVITFTRLINTISITRKNAIPASTPPTRIIVTLVKNVPSNADVKVFVCNNGFDATPAWEEIETFESGLAHTFSNKTKTAGQWGVNIKVTVDRNGADGACYISEIGGNFE